MFNTLKYAKKLEEVGFAREQAEAQVQMLAEVIETNLATKRDIDDLKQEMQKMEYRLVIKLGALVTIVTTTAVTILTLILK